MTKNCPVCGRAFGLIDRFANAEMCPTCFQARKSAVPAWKQELTVDPTQQTTSFEWNQNSYKFAVADCRRNWNRWLFWALLFVGAEALLIVMFPFNPGNHHADLRLFFPGIFFGAFAFQFLMALFMWPIQVGDGEIVLGNRGSKGARHYRLTKISSVSIRHSDALGSMLVVLKSGKEIEIFFGRERLLLPGLKKYFESAGISVREASL